MPVSHDSRRAGTLRLPWQDACRARHGSIVEAVESVGGHDRFTRHSVASDVTTLTNRWCRTLTRRQIFAAKPRRGQFSRRKDRAPSSEKSSRGSTAPTHPSPPNGWLLREMTTGGPLVPACDPRPARTGRAGWSRPAPGWGASGRHEPSVDVTTRVTPPTHLVRASWQILAGRSP